MSLNDPQWGRKGKGGGNDNQGPPDLDELWRNFNARLSGMFGRKPNGAPPPVGGGGPGMAQMGGGFGLLVILIAVVWLASGFYTVDPSQRAVVLTFGKYSETTDSGLHWRWPFPFQRHELVVLSQVRRIEIGGRNKSAATRQRESFMLTKDENIVDVNFAVQYVLKDTEDFLFSVRSPDETVQQVAESVMREVVGKSDLDSVLQKGRGVVAQTSHDLIQRILDHYRAGVKINAVELLNVQAPEQVQPAFSDAISAQSDLERLKNEGKAYYNDVVPKAQGTASRLLEEAEGYKQRVIANAEGEASRFKQVVSEYNKAPAVTRERMYLDTMQQIFTSTSKVMVDARSQGNVLFLPLDKLMQLSAGALPDYGMPKAPPPDIAPTPDSPNRSRDALRRDRETRP